MFFCFFSLILIEKDVIIYLMKEQKALLTMSEVISDVFVVNIRNQ